MDLTEFTVALAIAAMVVFVGATVVWMIRCAFRKNDSFASVATVIWRAVVIAVLLVIFIAVLGPLGFVWGGILVFVLIEGFRKHRASRQNALLWLLVVSAERLMPLGPAVEAFAHERGGLFGRRAKRLAKLLATGVPLPDALEFCPGLLPADALPIIRVGAQSGALAPALRQAATVHNQYEAVWMSLTGKVSYLLMLPIFGFLILVFVMIWIIPKFQKIFDDFGTKLPSMTQWLIQISYCLINYWYLSLPLFLLLLCALVHSVMRYFGWVDGDFPGLGRIVRRLDTARILDGLALIAQQQRPLGEGVAALAGTYPKPRIRQLLRLALGDIESGHDWAECLMHYGLIRRSDFAVLQAAQRVGNLPWALQEMADSSRRRFAYRVQAIVQAAFPPLVIFFGLIVMFIVVALFLPLVALIQALA